MKYSAAPCLKKFLADATVHWPKRNRASDGIMADARHIKAGTSDHIKGLAADITHDPLNGPNCHELSLQVVNDPRVTYVIWNGRIFKTRTGKWEIYRGSNPHRSHMHVSIKPEARNNLSPWPWSVEAVIKHGDRGVAVREIQLKLRVRADGIFGAKTEQAVRQFQLAHGLEVDGIVGPRTKAALFEKGEIE